MKTRLLLLPIVFALGGGATRLRAADANPWAQLAAQDIEAMHTVLRDSHPGALDDANPGFRKWLEEGYREALKRSRDVVSFEGYVFTIYGYGYDFGDPSIHLSFSLQKEWFRWPGFVVTREGDDRYIVHVPEALRDPSGHPRDGDTLLSCDGLSPRQLIEHKVFPFFGSANGESGWDWAASHLFIDGGNPFADRPARCEFQSGGTTQGVALEWIRIPKAALFEQIREATLPSDRHFGIRPFGKGRYWIGLPTFSDVGDNPEAVRLLAGLPKLHDAKVVVLDVRGNPGGDFQWASTLLDALFGRDYLEAKSPSPAIVDWRVSKENYRKHQEFLELIGKQLGPDSKFYTGFKASLAGYAAALAANQPFYREARPARPAAAVPETPSALGKAKVYLLTDGSCVGTCLSFADRLLETHSAVQVGLPTGADHPYVAGRDEPLPSGILSVSIATKILRDRRRGDQPYLPQYRWDKDIRDTRAIEKWIARLAGSR
jgi:hypothetical protein